MSLKCNSVRAALDGLQKPLNKLNLLRIEIDEKQNPDFQRLNDNCPNLRYLYLSNGSANMEYFESTHFDNVEFFGIYCSQSFLPLPFTFSKLKHFHVNGRGIILNNHFYETLTSAKYLTQLELMAINSIVDDTFDKILRSEHFLTNIKKVTVAMDKDILVNHWKNSHFISAIQEVNHIIIVNHI